MIRAAHRAVSWHTMAEQSAQIPAALRARLSDAIAARGLSVRQVILRLPQRAMATSYRILAGTTSDPHTSTILALCRTIDVDPDELLGARRPALDPEAEALLEDTEALDEADRRLLVKVIRSITGRHGAHPLPSEASSGRPDDGSVSRRSRQ